MPSAALSDLTHTVIRCAIRVHDLFGPGLVESAYLLPFIWELEDHDLLCRKQVSVSLEYRGRRINNAYVMDILVEELVVVEVKAVEQLLPVHLAQTISYVRLANMPAGLLINFHEKYLVDGVRRVLNDRPTRPNPIKSIVG